MKTKIGVLACFACVSVALALEPLDVLLERAGEQLASMETVAAEILCEEFVIQDETIPDAGYRQRIYDVRLGLDRRADLTRLDWIVLAEFPVEAHEGRPAPHFITGYSRNFITGVWVLGCSRHGLRTEILGLPPRSMTLQSRAFLAFHFEYVLDPLKAFRDFVGKVGGDGFPRRPGQHRDIRIYPTEDESVVRVVLDVIEPMRGHEGEAYGQLLNEFHVERLSGLVLKHSIFHRVFPANMARVEGGRIELSEEVPAASLIGRLSLCYGDDHPIPQEIVHETWVPTVRGEEVVFVLSALRRYSFVACSVNSPKVNPQALFLHPEPDTPIRDADNDLALTPAEYLRRMGFPETFLENARGRNLPLNIKRFVE